MVRDMGKTCSMRATKNSDRQLQAETPQAGGSVYQRDGAYESEIFEWTVYKYGNWGTPRRYASF